jgi:hypothetical protein
MSWKANFYKPIALPNGRKLVTLIDAANYFMAFLKSNEETPEVARAVLHLMEAAERRLPIMHAGVAVALAIHGPTPIPESRPSKERHWGPRKLARDR